jgi:hypothetical protein
VYELPVPTDENSQEIDTIAELLADTMAKQGLTQTETARLLGCSQPTLNQWLRGNNVPREDRLSAIAKLTGYGVDQLSEMRRSLKRAAITTRDLEAMTWEIRLLRRDLQKVEDRLEKLEDRPARGGRGAR